MARDVNPLWPQYHPPDIVVIPQFERVCQRLNLRTPSEMRSSLELHHWVRRWRFSRYVPEWLLKSWGLLLWEGEDGRGRFSN